MTLGEESDTLNRIMTMVIMIVLLVPLISNIFDHSVSFLTSIRIAIAQSNNPPTANAQSVTTAEDTAITITLSGSDSDLGNGTLTFSIVTIPTKGTLNAITSTNATSATVTYTPNANFNGNDSFTFKANDGTADSSNATVSIVVNPVNDAPVANAGIDQTVNEGTLVTLNGTSSFDIDSNTLTHSWTQTEGPNATLSNATSATATFTAPAVNATRVLAFQLVASDGTLNSTDTVNVTVNNVGNDPPVANAGADQSVNGGTLVTLDATASSDTDGDLLAFSWRQTEGPRVTLSDHNVAKPTFTAPSVTTPTTLTFELTVSDGNFSTLDTVNITVGKIVVTNPISIENNALIDQLGNAVTSAGIDVPVGIKAEVKNTTQSKQTLSVCI